MIQLLFSPVSQIAIELGNEAKYYSLVDATPAPERVRASITFANDWRVAEVAGPADLSELLAVARLDRARELALSVLDSLSESLTRRVLESLEELLANGVSATDLTVGLVVAPLRDSKSPSRLATIALSHNFSAVAAVFNELGDLQPLLKRFASTWLSLPDDLFVQFGRPRSRVWNMLIEHRLMRSLLEAPTRTAFTSAWATLAFHERAPADRLGIIEIGRRLSAAIFHGVAAPELDHARAAPRVVVDDASRAPKRSERRVRAGDRKERALKQIEAITKSIAAGEDERVFRFVGELVRSQLDLGEPEYAVRSLCNVAQYAAEAYRADYERFCLREAMRITPSDAWTWVQWGDHLKRLGKFSGAVQAFRRADALGNPVGASAIGDVYAQQGLYDKALEHYRSLPGWETDEVLQTAYADVLRFAGRHDEAMERYRALVRQFTTSTRAFAGMAESLRARGQFEEALRIYDNVVSQPGVEERDALVNRAARCQLLKVVGRVDEAYREADALVRVRPFNMGARVLRASALALLNRETEGLNDVASTRVPLALGEWRQTYLKGLLLLKLRRYKEARDALAIRAVRAAATQGDELLRLAAAFSFLQWVGPNPAEADRIIADVGPGSTLHERYLRQVLQLHVATLREDEARMRELWRALDSVQEVAVIVLALKRRDYRTAAAHELEMFLKAA